MPESDPIDFPNEGDKKATFEEFRAAMREAEARLVVWTVL
jgi:hypothetical protein